VENPKKTTEKNGAENRVFESFLYHYPV